MKRITYLLGILSILPTFYACEKDIDSFDTSTHYIYFDTPFKLNQYGQPTSQREDSLSYSFALDDASIDHTLIKVPVGMSGVPAQQDIPYEIKVVQEQTTATDNEWNAADLQHTSIKAGNVRDTLEIRFNRTDALEKEWRHIQLQLVPTGPLKLGVQSLSTVKISVSDILLKPDWWNNWVSYFGEYHREVYLKWIELYPEGKDSQTNYGNGEPLSWKNMPVNPNPSWYPTLHMFVNVLKQYFTDNDIYPNGDTTKDPIRLP